MSAEKCGPVLTQEMIRQAAERAAARAGQPSERVISVKAHEMLKKIHTREPGWDSWHVSGEIWYKAYKMGLLDEE